LFKPFSASVAENMTQEACQMVLKRENEYEKIQESWKRQGNDREKEGEKFSRHKEKNAFRNT